MTTSEPTDLMLTGGGAHVQTTSRRPTKKVDPTMSQAGAEQDFEVTFVLGDGQRITTAAKADDVRGMMPTTWVAHDDEGITHLFKQSALLRVEVRDPATSIEDRPVGFHFPR